MTLGILGAWKKPSNFNTCYLSLYWCYILFLITQPTRYYLDGCIIQKRNMCMRNFSPLWLVNQYAISKFVCKEDLRSSFSKVKVAWGSLEIKLYFFLASMFWSSLLCLWWLMLDHKFYILMNVKNFFYSAYWG